MSTLYAFGFEGGVVPPGVTPTGSMRPIIGRRVSDNLSTWGLSSSFTAVGQASVSLNTTTSNTKIGGSFFFRADNLDFTTPDAIVTFGGVTFKLTSATNLRLTYGATDVDLTIPTLSTGWHVLQFNIDLAGTTNAIAYAFDAGVLQQVSPSVAVGGTSNTLTIRSTKGFPSILDDIRIETAIANGSVPLPIECRKSSMQVAFRNQWSPSGVPTGTSSGLNIRGVTYVAANNLFYAINSAGAIYSMDPETLIPTLIVTADSANYGHCAMVYHQALNRLYFVGNGNVVYMNLATNALTYSVQTVYYDDTTHASGAYYEPSTGNAYIVTQKNSGSVDSVAVHKIDISGTYTSTVSNGVYTPAAPLTRHFNVVFDKTTDSILFPMFSSKVIGKVTQDLVFTISSVETNPTVACIVDAGQYFAGVGTFLVGTTASVRKYSAGLLSNYASVTFGSGMAYHHALGLILGPAGSALNRLDKASYTLYVQATGAFPGAVAMLSQVNPVTGGLMFIYNNSLSECHLLTSQNVSSLLVKDANYIQSTVNNSEMLLLPSAIANASQSMIKQNVMLKGMFGTGSISLNGTVNNTSSSPANYAQAIDPLPLPEVLYDCDGATSIGDVVNLGSGASTISGSITIGTTAGYLIGKRCVSGNPVIVSNPAAAVGTGDFTLFVIGNGGNSTLSDNIITLGSGTNLKLSHVGALVTFTVMGVAVYTFNAAPGERAIKIGRSSGVLYLHINGILLYSGPFTNSITLSTVITSVTYHMKYLTTVNALAFWGTQYIADPNPIASLNRREVRVIKSS